ncbi:MAG: hypothetical protein GQ534_07130 [Candidatus Delongbacteria bacterium]|nr:hypothetical protein [Candidatus Delongbacteria bacterium]
MKKKWTMLLVVMFALTSLVLTSCSDDDDSVGATINSTEDLVTYLNNDGMGLTDMLVNWIKTADAVNVVMTDDDATNDYYIMDLRNETLYGKGHIPGAHNVALADVITEAAKANGQTIALVCYTGQSACHGVVGLRLAGYSDAFSIKWGMAGWHTDIDGNTDGDLEDVEDLKFNYWTGGTAQLNHANWVAPTGNVTVPTTTYPLPDLVFEGVTDDARILARANYVVNNFHKVTATTVLDSVSIDGCNYFVNNYWAQSDVDLFGNIDTANRIMPAAANDLLQYLDPSMSIVTYCWTGQTSSIITAYLSAIGYDAWSLGNGSNSMIFDDLTAAVAHNWDASTILDLPLEGTLGD